MIADIINDKELIPVVTELPIRGMKLNISIVVITQSYFKVPKEVRVNITHFFTMKIPNKRELQRFSTNHSSDVDFNVFMKQTYKSLLLMIRLKMKNYNTILIERLQKRQPYHQTKLIIMYVLQVKKYYFLIKNKL